MGTLVAVAIPFKNFREKIRLTKHWINRAKKVEINNNFVIVEMEDL
ncbi:hypothetical protein [Clostridium sp. YIM B02551]|nr:hypothetical protein [Clostridium sp. YIM B02551]